MEYYYCNAAPREVVNPAVERRSMKGDRSGEVGFFAIKDIKAGSIVITADALSLFELGCLDDLREMQKWAEFLVGKLSLATLSDLYPRTLAQAKTLPILGQSDAACKVIDAVEAHIQTMPVEGRDHFIQESLLFHKLVANAFSYTNTYMCVFHAPSVFNHCREPNIGTTSNGKRMVFHAKRDIVEGEELTINYGNNLYD